MRQALAQIAIAHLGTRDLVDLAQGAVDRPERSAALGIDFYRRDHQRLPLDRMRFCVARFEWQGTRWRRVYKHTGPLTITEAHTRLKCLSDRLNHPTITDI